MIRNDILSHNYAVSACVKNAQADLRELIGAY